MKASVNPQINCYTSTTAAVLPASGREDYSHFASCDYKTQSFPEKLGHIKKGTENNTNAILLFSV